MMSKIVFVFVISSIKLEAHPVLDQSELICVGFQMIYL